MLAPRNTSKNSWTAYAHAPTKANDTAFQRSEYERMTNGMIEIYLGALRDAKASRGVIGRIHG